MKQTHRQSMVEAVVNTAAGLVFSYFIQEVLVWAYDVHMSHATSVQFVFWFTVASVVRSYALRRFFNWWHYRGHT